MADSNKTPDEMVLGQSSNAEFRSDLTFISEYGDEIYVTQVLEAEDDIPSISSEDVPVLITNVLCLTVGAAGTGEAARNSSTWVYYPQGERIDGLYNTVIECRKLIDAEVEFKKSKGKPYKNWRLDMMANVGYLSTDKDEYAEAVNTGLYEYFQMSHK